MRIFLLLIAALAAPAQNRVLIDEDFTRGTTMATRPQDPGEFTSEGWRANSPRCQMKWDLGRHYPQAVVEYEIKGPLDQAPKRTTFSAWNEEAAADGDRKTQAFFQLRLFEHGMMLRLSYRPGGRSYEGKTGRLNWDPARWYKLRGEWNTAGGECRLFRDGVVIQSGKFNSTFEGFRWLFIGKDNYQRFESVPGVIYRNLKVTVPR